MKRGRTLVAATCQQLADTNIPLSFRIADTGHVQTEDGLWLKLPGYGSVRATRRAGTSSFTG